MLTTDLKLLWRDWRGGQLSLIVSALVLAVTVVTAVGLLADRVERGLSAQISSFLAADLAIRGGVPIDAAYQSEAASRGLTTATTAEFRSMAFAGERNHLASVKAVDNAYPLRGLLQVTDQLAAIENPQQGSIEQLQQGPPAGEVWVDARLLTLLDIDLGASIELGYSQLKVSKVIVSEPDRGTGFSVAGARILMSTVDLAESRLIVPGSRVTYRLLVAGEQAVVDGYAGWAEAHMAAEGEAKARHYRLFSPRNSEERLDEALQRGRAFLLLSGTIGVLLAGLALALASHRYATRLTDQVALMKAWGQSATAIRRSQFIRLAAIALSTTLLGMLAGWLAHFVLLEIASELFDAKLPAPGLRPWLVALITGVICVIGFALPALWHLPAIAPLRVLRRDLPDSALSRGRRLLIGSAVLAGLTIWYSESLMMSGMFLATLLVLFLLCGLVAFQLLKMVQRLGSWRGSTLRLGLANLWRRRDQTLVQLVGFSVTLMLLLVLVGTRTSLISEWQQQVPDDAPTHFMFNVRTDQLPPVKQLLTEYGISASDWYPMVRGRLVGINGAELSTERLQQADGLAREVNFTQVQELPVANTIVDGQWWQSDEFEQPLFSIEQEVAEQLGVGVGDDIEFSVGGIQFTAKLASIRYVDWQSMTPNFYIIFSPGTLDTYAPNWITAVRLPDATASAAVDSIDNRFIVAVIQQFPTAVVIELRQLMERIRGVISRVTQGLEMIMLLVLACGGLVLFAAIGVSFDERLRENALLRTLGSSRKTVLGALAVEFAALGAIAGFIAAAGAEIVLYVVQAYVFELTPGLHPWLWLLGLVSGIVIITALGLARSRAIVTVPPLQSLRQIA